VERWMVPGYLIVDVPEGASEEFRQAVRDMRTEGMRLDVAWKYPEARLLADFWASAERQPIPVDDEGMPDF